MRKKILLNVLLNLGLIVSILGAAWAYRNQSPLIIVFFVAVAAGIIYFKIQLIKELRKGFESEPTEKKK